ncbi:MAG: LacI family DNA-binding transcriptional regulator [Chloroflexia bacterium]|nr:LacI family DNA-binding transcriptional regulator [Chloroflexia bacterium]
MKDVPSFRGKRPTQADVARLAAVSQPVVSYVLNTDALVPVAPETRRRVLAAIAQLGYVPDRAARSLRLRKTFTIAGIIPDITNAFYPAFERGIQDVAESHGYDVIVYNTDGEAEKEARCLSSAQGRVDGIIAVFFHMTANDLRPLLERQVAVVRLEATRQETGPLPLDNLYVDNVAAARDAVVHLIGRGHRRIAMIVGHGGPRRPRIRGYQAALREHRIAFDPSLLRETEFVESGGYEAMRELLWRSPRPTAVFAANDLLAMGALIALRESGLRVPADVAVVGFDDIPAARLVDPPLTTVAQFPRRLGQRAAELLFERLTGNAPEGGRREACPYELVIRASA